MRHSVRRQWIALEPQQAHQAPGLLPRQDGPNDGKLEIVALAEKSVLHGDNGATLKAATMLAMLFYWQGIKPSYSRPRVRCDNAYAEAQFRTAKYRPEFPARGFEDLEAARSWARGFVRWYNVENRHSGVRYVSPAQLHAGEDHVDSGRLPRALCQRPSASACPLDGTYAGLVTHHRGDPQTRARDGRRHRK